jgi:hypothetical protein
MLSFNCVVYKRNPLKIYFRTLIYSPNGIMRRLNWIAKGYLESEVTFLLGISLTAALRWLVG